MGVWFSSFWKPKKRLEDLDDDCLKVVLDQLSPANLPKIQLEDMNDYCLLEVLDRLSPASLLKMARVNKRLNRLVEEKLRVKIQKVVVESEWKGIHFIVMPLKALSSCRHRTFNSNEIVYFDSMFAQKKNTEEEMTRKDFHSATAKDRYIKTLARFASIKSIDFGVQELTNEVLQEVAKLCPEIECLTVKRSVVDESVWNDFFTQFGHQIIHFKSLLDEGTIFHEALSNQLDSLLSVRVLEMVVLMCPNIKQIECYLVALNNHLIALLKQLPKDCYVSVVAYSVIEPIDDTLDFLFCNCLVRPCFKNRFNKRLNELGFSIIRPTQNQNEEPNFGVEFANLKKLNWRSVKRDSKPEIDFLCACRFPKLESFEFKANSDLTENDYHNLFGNMPQVKLLRIECFVDQLTVHNFNEYVLPGEAVLQLKKLATMLVAVDNCQLDWQSESFVQRINWYVEEIRSLKKLGVALVGEHPEECKIRDKMQMIGQELKQLKKSKKRVKIVVM